MGRDALGDFAATTEILALLYAEKIRYSLGNYVQGQKQREKIFLNNFPK